MRLLICALAILGMSCADGSRGLVFNGTGVHDDTPENARNRTVEMLTSDLQQELIMPVQVRIDDLPFYREMGRRYDEGWYYNSVIVNVDLITISTDETAATQRCTEIVGKRMRPAVIGGPANLDVRVVIAPPGAQPITQAPRIDPAVEMAAPTAITTNATTYVVQLNDTLGVISSVFYGSPKYWRKIIDANPGLDPTRLKVGVELQIPALDIPTATPGAQPAATE